MHDAAYHYVASIVAGQRYHRVLEVGGRDVNGAVKGLIDFGTYISIDLEDGPGVDVVGDAREFMPAWSPSLVICCEVLEHAPQAREVVEACVRFLKPGGRLVLTCAGPGRAPHSGHDGGPLQPGEHYANIQPDELETWLAEDLEAVRVTYNGIAKDCYATGIKR